MLHIFGILAVCFVIYFIITKGPGLVKRWRKHKQICRALAQFDAPPIHWLFGTMLEVGLYHYMYIFVILSICYFETAKSSGPEWCSNLRIAV